MDNLEEIKKLAGYCYDCKNKPCTKGCPLENEIPEFIGAVKKENLQLAYEILSKKTVLPAVCGIICPHTKQCQGNCIRGIKGEPTSIGKIESFVGNWAIEKGIDIKKQAMFIDTNNKKVAKVAIVGGGPAGLTCAAFLAKKGYDVTIFERHNKLGGLLAHGIPKFRLDEKIVKACIEKILKLGIHVVYNTNLGKDIFISDLTSNFEAVFLSFGANISSKMNIDGENLDGVYGGNELLENNNHPNYNDKKIAVIGGGNVAMDTARTIKRLGAKEVTVIYRRSEKQMPAEPKEVSDAKNEGINFLFQTNLVRINGKKHVEKIECIKTELKKIER